MVVGAGPVGIKTAQELHRRQSDSGLVIYGDEPTEPYNRVRLSGFLSGELTWQALTRDLVLPQTRNVEARLGCGVVAIDRECRTVRDAAGCVQPYATLVLATGSRPHVPGIPGMTLPGVYTFRDARDVQKLIARRVRSAAPSCSAAVCSASKPRAPCSVSIRTSASSSTSRGS